MGSLYRLTSPSGKQYIGITTAAVRERFLKHVNDAKHGAQTYLARAIRRHGAAIFKLETLVMAEGAFLQELECFAIRAFGTLSPNGYNLTTGGQFFRHTVETKEKISVAVRNRMTVKEREHRSIRSKMLWTRDAFREKMLKALAKTSKRTRAQRAVAMSRKWQEPGYRERVGAKISVSQRGRKRPAQRGPRPDLVKRQKIFWTSIRRAEASAHAKRGWTAARRREQSQRMKARHGN